MGPAHKDLSGNMAPAGEKEEFPMVRMDGEPLVEDIEKLSKPKKPLQWCSDVDKNWSWVVLVVNFWMFLLGNGAQFAFGVMYSSIRRHFETTKATTSWILLLQRGTGSVFGKYVHLAIDLASLKKAKAVSWRVLQLGGWVNGSRALRGCCRGFL